MVRFWGLFDGFRVESSLVYGIVGSVSWVMIGVVGLRAMMFDIGKVLISRVRRVFARWW